MEGKTIVDTTLTAEERHQKVFTFISGEAKQIIASTMKQLGSKMDNLEKKHYDSKFSQLEQEIDEAQKKDGRVTID